MRERMNRFPWLWLPDTEPLQLQMGLSGRMRMTAGCPFQGKPVGPDWRLGERELNVVPEELPEQKPT